MNISRAERSTSRQGHGGLWRVRMLTLLIGATLAMLALSEESSAAWSGPALATPRGAAQPIFPNGRPRAIAPASSAWSSLSWAGAAASVGPGYVALDGSPGFPPVANPRTHTVYVPIQCQDPSSTDTCNQTASHAIDVLNSATCSSSVASDCHIVARAVAGREPITAILDPGTDTLYVGDFLGGKGHSGSVTVVDAATCNATTSTGCGKPLATIKLDGGFAAAEALDPATGTLYVSSPTGRVYVLAVGDCNATSTSGCATPVKSIADPLGPAAVAVNIATDTIYVPNGANFPGSTVSVIDGSTCNAQQSSGCGQAPPTVAVGSSPQWALVDQATNTVYVANAASGSVSVIDGGTCNATITSGCGQTPPQVFTGSGDNYLARDTSRHTLFVLNQDNETMSAIDINACHATHLSGCPMEARNEQVPFNPPEGGAPNSFALVPETGTAYVVNGGGENVLQALSIRGCSALDTSACRTEAPHVAQHEFFPRVDEATHTLYAGNGLLPRIDVFNADTCTADHLSACTPVAEIPAPGAQANLGVIDSRTHTLYAGNVLKDTAGDIGNTISVINIARCNAGDTSGCHAAAPTVTVGDFPGAPVLDTATHTLYDEYGFPLGDHVAVLDTAHCNAQDSSQCAQHPASIAVPPGANFTALSQATDTIYQPSFTTGTVSVINGATCNASDHSGCDHVAASITVGPTPTGIAVNDSRHTVYVANGGGGDSPGTVSVINTETCNGTHPSGCAQTWPFAAVGRGPSQIVQDARTGELYIADLGSAAVSELNGNTCNASTTRGCAGPTRMVPTAGGSGTLAVDPQTNTVYADSSIGSPTFGGSDSLSVFRGLP